jgi:hypothetical protein
VPSVAPLTTVRGTAATRGEGAVDGSEFWPFQPAQRETERRRKEKAYAAGLAREQKADDQLRRQQEREDRQAYLQAQRDLAAERTEAAECYR